MARLLNYFGIMKHHRIGKFTIVQHASLHRVWEEDHVRRVLAEFDVDCVFDVGANYGQYAEMLRRDVGFGGLIISFEPLPEAARALRERARGDSKWLVEELALSSQNGEQHFNVMESSVFSSLSEPRNDEIDMLQSSNFVANSITVKTETLESAYQRLQQQHGFRRPYLKLDTQGYDTTIVSSSRSVIRNFIGIQSELSIKKLYEDSVDYRETTTLYEQCGFGLSAFIPNNPPHFHFPYLVETDAIFIRSDLMAEYARHQTHKG